MTPPASDHFNGKTFFQPGSHPERSFWDVLRWKFTSRAAKWPAHVALASQPPPPAPTGRELVLTWLGHATYLLQTGAGNVLFDPVFSERTSPVAWAGPRRVHPVPMPLDALPRIDVVCVTHDHYDHCDAPTLRWLARHTNADFVAPLRHRDLLAGFGARRITELDWWQTHRLNDRLQLTLTPTKHWTKRLGTARNHRLWGGFWVRVRNAKCGVRKEKAPPGVSEAAAPSAQQAVGGDDPRTRDESPIRENGSALRTPQSALRIQRNSSVWFVGDSGYDAPLFREVRERCGVPDVALVPIGAYEPRWFMAPMHMNPAEAVRLHREAGATLSLAMHWGTFQLTDEAREEPVRALERARADAGLAPDAFRVLAPGESVRVE